jgi:hypothetical protein
MIEGTLHLDMLPQNAVRLVFMPHTQGTKSRPLEIKDTGLLLSDLESFWGFTSTKANAAVTQLERDGHVELSVTVSQPAVGRLFS